MAFRVSIGVIRPAGSAGSLDPHHGERNMNVGNISRAVDVRIDGHSRFFRAC